MSWGLRTKIGGAVHYDSTITDLGRHIATIETQGADGSWSNAALSTGQVDYQITAVGTGSLLLPQITVSGNTLSWVYPDSTSVPANRVNCHIAVWVV